MNDLEPVEVSKINTHVAFSNQFRELFSLEERLQQLLEKIDPSEKPLHLLHLQKGKNLQHFQLLKYLFEHFLRLERSIVLAY